MVGKKLKVGVLALQGAFQEHGKVIVELGHEYKQVKLPKDLESIDALIIPGGESTTIARIAEEYKLIEPLQEYCKQEIICCMCI